MLIPVHQPKLLVVSAVSLMRDALRESTLPETVSKPTAQGTNHLHCDTSSGKLFVPLMMPSSCERSFCLWQNINKYHPIHACTQVKDAVSRLALGPISHKQRTAFSPCLSEAWQPYELDVCRGEGGEGMTAASSLPNSPATSFTTNESCEWHH